MRRLIFVIGVAVGLFCGLLLGMSLVYTQEPPYAR